MELFKKHRPKTLERVVGCQETVAALKNMLVRKTLPHTILFHGPSGCGKTTLARIVRRELGCLDVDWREVNSSSFRGIDSIREIVRVMNLAPVGPCRIWMIDECHKLTNDAQNAALKMLEDTPRHVYFLLCTTDPQKLIKAVLTRCTEMEVPSLTYKELGILAKRVSKREKLEFSDEEMEELMGSSQGSARTLLVLMDKIRHLESEGRLAAIATKLAEDNEAIELCRALIKKERWKKVAGILKNLKGEPESIRYSVLGYARAVLLGDKANPQAFVVLDSFRDNFYDSKEYGLAAACWEVIHGQ